MEKREIGACLNRETLERLTEEAFRETEAPGEKRHWGRRVLAMAASLAIVAGVCFPGTVYGAVRSLLYFFPGGGVTEEPPASYWLPEEELTASSRDAVYTVTYLYRRGDALALRVEKKNTVGDIRQSIDYEENSGGSVRQPVPHYEEGPPAPEGSDPNIWSLPYHGESLEAIPLNPDAPPSRQIPGGALEIAFRDEAGQFLELEHQGRNTFAVYDETTGWQELAEELEISGFTLERFTLVLDGTVELPVTLRQIDTEVFALDGAVTVRDAGYDLSLLPLNSRCTRFALIPTPVTEAGIPAESYWTPTTFDLTAVDSEGTVWPVESAGSRPGCQEFYIAGLPEVEITGVTATGILESTRYEKSPASLTLPAMALGEERALDQELRLWNMTLRAEAAGLDNEGRMWVRLGTTELPEGTRFNQLDLEWPQQKGQGTAGGIRESRTQGNETVTFSREKMTDRAGKTTRLEVSFASVVREGRWVFRW